MAPPGYTARPGCWPVGGALAHESAALHVSGRALYTDDMPELQGTLHAALGLARVAHGRVRSLDLGPVLAAPGVHSVISAADIPGTNDCGPVLHDDPILAPGLVQFYGQPLFALAASTHEAARRAARLARVDYEPLPALLDVDAALAAQSWVLPPVELRQGDIESALARAPRRLAGAARLGGQEHFYLEGQVAYALPGENDTLHLHCSTQHPSEMQQMLAHALGWRAHQVSVECRRMGGAFGGKESQSAQVACVCALLAVRTQRPVKLRLDRDDDMTITGKRHDFWFDYEAGFDETGLLLGLRLTLASRCGFSADLSGPVNDRALFHVDNAYFLDALALRSLRCKTHTVSNTAFRGFGGPQGMFVIETVMDDIARALDRDPLAVRRVNFYGSDPTGPRNTTHYGMSVEDNVIPALVDQLARDCRYEERRAAVVAFNANSTHLKRGLALTPVKFGISFTATHYNQAGALVHIYTDGTVLVSHGGTEMGQGLHTKVAQVVAGEFGLPMDDVRVASTDTTRVPNTSATAASAGTDLNGKAAQQASAAIRARLAEFAARGWGVEPSTVGFRDGQVYCAGRTESFRALVARAYRARLKLWESGFYATPKIHYDPKTMRGRPFYYFTYGAAAAEVAIDTLTGEHQVLRVDLLQDVGRSINPAIDIGQTEGGFIQGMGWLTTEELWWRPDGPEAGRLMTHSPSTYKIPTASDCPERMNVSLYDNRNAEDSIHRSKAVGEPPLMLAFSVFFALREAVAAALGPGCRPGLDAPATPEAILRAIARGRDPVEGETPAP